MVSSGKFVLWSFIALCALGTLHFWLVIFPREHLRVRCTSPRNACVNNLRQIDGAKEQYSLENHLTNGAPIRTSGISPYIKGGMPTCPAGGFYSIKKAGQSPTCSIGGHRI
jgi:hypothetical protein